MTETLPPFNPDATCPKCGSRDISVKHSWLAKEPKWVRVECMNRICRSCGYEWEELPLDAMPADDDEPDMHIPDWLPADLHDLSRIAYRRGHDGLAKTLEASASELERWVDDEPDDAYLAAKLTSQVPPDAQKPVSYYLYPEDAAESNYERLTPCAQEAPLELAADSEPSIPVSRVVAVLAEPIITYEHLATVDSPGGRMTWPEHDRHCVALHYSLAVNLDISEALRAELARRKGAA